MISASSLPSLQQRRSGDTDRFLQTAGGNRSRLVVPFARAPGQEDTAPLVGAWDIVLDRG
jgi:hypothetical protein